MNELELSYKYQPLFELLNPDYFPEVDTVIITGGRASAKSFAVATHSAVALVEYQWNVLYTRYTNMSIVDSVKPEVSDKIELLGYESRVNDTQTEIEKGKNRISFKGIKTGAKVQTANLKSLMGFNCFVVDEAEEIPDYDTFKKVFYSIRSIKKRNLTILILNPTTKEHWMFKEFFEKHGLEGGENTIIGNVMYIHTSYLDVNPIYIPANILRDYEQLKIDNPTKYDNIVLGGWVQDPEGVLIPSSKIKFGSIEGIPAENIPFRFSVGDPADTGGDKYSMPFIDVLFTEEKRIVNEKEITDSQFGFYVSDVIHSTAGIEANTERIIDKMKDNLTQQVFIESNGVGLAAVLLIKKAMNQHQKLSAFPAIINKEVRIFSHYEFVLKYFIFNKDKYDNDKEYRAFVNDLCQYSKDGDNKHKKDAIDVLCSSAAILKIKYAKMIYGK